MKKIIFLLLSGIVITVILIFSSYKLFFSGNNITRQEIRLEELEEDIEYRLSGYYYFGFVDIRDKEDNEFEKDYFYNMDTHFQDYYNDLFIITQNDNKPKDYKEYFETIDGLELYSIPKTNLKLKNGDYITFIVKSPIKESYPMTIEKIEDVEVLHPRISK